MIASSFQQPSAIRTAIRTAANVIAYNRVGMCACSASGGVRRTWRHKKTGLQESEESHSRRAYTEEKVQQIKMKIFKRVDQNGIKKVKLLV